MKGPNWCHTCSTRRLDHELDEDWSGNPCCPKCGTRVS